MQDRRRFLALSATAFAGLAAGGYVVRGADLYGAGYGPLRPDPAGFLDLPEGFTYRILSRLGDPMDDGLTVPDNADGMGCFALADGTIALVRNHELTAGEGAGGLLAAGFDRRGADGMVLPGGTTTLVLDPATLAIRRQFRSLAGTIRNCAGGTTPWGSWLTCEEDVTRAGEVGQDHGWVFEVPAEARGLVAARPLTALGRFRHEAAAVDPATGNVYMTEDRDGGLLYRFVPSIPGRLDRGGRLQALALAGGPGDSRNWRGADMAVGQWHGARWIDLDGVDSPGDDLRHRGAKGGATLFARAEGIHMGLEELYFCRTSGGAKGLGQVFRLTMGNKEKLQLFFESASAEEFNFGDNLTVAPNGHLVVCEDQYTARVDNHLRGISPSGKPYALARLNRQTELAGACFSPDGQTLFVNAFSPARTLAIRGPWTA